MPGMPGDRGVEGKGTRKEPEEGRGMRGGIAAGVAVRQNPRKTTKGAGREADP
nr:hypothetical protein GCM10025699_54880 [Microbacterium flavescens]